MGRSPAIPVVGIDGSFEAEGAIYQYMAVIPGTDDHQVAPIGAGIVVTDGPDIEGIAQEDANDTEAVAVRISGVSWAYNIGGVTRNDALCPVGNVTGNINGSMATADPTVSYTGKMIAGRALEDAVTLAKFKMFVECRIVFQGD